jgi:hypothetical protein
VVVVAAIILQALALALAEVEVAAQVTLILVDIVRER